MIISSIQAVIFTTLFLSFFIKKLKPYEPHLLVAAIVVNTISVVTTPELIVALVDGFGACVVGYILYKDYIKNSK